LINVNTSTPNVLQAVWLDPFRPLDDEQRALLGEAGVALHAITTLGDLTLALRRAHVMIIRLGDSAELLREVQTLIGQLGFNVPVICRVERRRMEVTVDAMRHGALHVLPIDECSVQAWQDAMQGMQMADSSQPKSFVFVDPVSQHLLALAQRVAQTEVTALLVGPTGAGKEVLARVLHESSHRAKGPFVALNCSALPEHLIEDMLFGHEKGAFTGAHKDHKGLFEQAQGGTVFLDEIGEMPIHLQAKLLRVLQEKKLNRLGGETSIDLDVRVIAATNKDLRLAIEAREFREDLYFRISTFRLRIQPLCERPGDILPLAMQALNRLAKDSLPLSLSMEAQMLLQQYPWPGNVRELENVMQRAVVLCRGRVVTPAHLMFDENQPLYLEPMPPVAAVAQEVQVVAPTSPSADSFMASASSDDMKTPQAEDLFSAVKASEHQVILAAIQASESRVEAAKKLGISPRTLRYKLAQLRDRGMDMAIAA
jgi:two-component system response regulator FlrC